MVSEKLNGLELLSENEINKCNRETKFAFTSSEYNEVIQLIKKLLLENKRELTKVRCTYYYHKYISIDQLTTVLLIKQQMWGGLAEEVIFTTMKKLCE